MTLPEHYELAFEQAVKELEETDKMRYVTSIERRAIQKGIEQGTLQTLYEAIFEILEGRFQAVPEELATQIANVTKLDQLKGLLRDAIVVGSIEEFEHLLETNP